MRSFIASLGTLKNFRAKCFFKKFLYLGSFYLFLVISSCLMAEDTCSVQERMRAIRQFTLSSQHVMRFELLSKDRTLSGELQSRVLSDSQNEIILRLFLTGNQEIKFNKFCPQTPLLNQCPYPIDHWLEPIVPEAPGCCYLMMAMPFLNWNLVKFERTAKRGRKALRCYFSAPADFIKVRQVVVYIDENFNTIMEAIAYDDKNAICAQFSLQSLKKFGEGHWYLKSATFQRAGSLTKMLIRSIKLLEGDKWVSYVL